MKTKNIVMLAAVIGVYSIVGHTQAFERCNLGRRMGFGWGDGYNARACCHAYGQQWSAPPIEYVMPACTQPAPIHHGYAAPVQQPLIQQQQPTPAPGWFGGPQPTPALPSSQATPMNFDQPSSSNASVWRRNTNR